MNQPTDRVFLRGLAIQTTIGFIEWERHVKQTVVIDLEVPVDCALAARADDVVDTVNYKSMAKRTIAQARTLQHPACPRLKRCHLLGAGRVRHSNQDLGQIDRQPGGVGVVLLVRQELVYILLRDPHPVFDLPFAQA